MVSKILMRVQFGPGDGCAAGGEDMECDQIGTKFVVGFVPAG